MAAVTSDKAMDLFASAPPIVPSMDNYGSSSVISVSPDSPYGEFASGSPDRQSTSAPGSSKQGQPSSKVEEYRQLFRLPPDEDLIQDFNCALQENFLLQGHMYLFVHHICFYSNLFGFETKKIIPFHEISSVRRANAVAVFPTAIEVIAGGKKYFFTSFLSRDEAFRLINDGWLLHTNGSKEITDPQELKPEANLENGGTTSRQSGVSEKQADELNSIEREKETLEPEDSTASSASQLENDASSLGLPDGKKNDEDAAQTSQNPSSEISSAWQPEDDEAPGVPDIYAKVAESKFPIQVEEFFQIFISDNGYSFQEAFHKRCGDKDFKCSSWQPHEKFGHICDASFQHPIKIYLGTKFGSCKQAQRYKIYRNSHLVLETSQVINDVPYGDYFSVEGRWDVERDINDSNHGCILSVYINVSFSKKTIWRGKIVQSTQEECREVYAIWINLAHELLKQKNIEKEEGTKQIQTKSQTVTEITLDSGASDANVSLILPDVKTVNRLKARPEGNSSDGSVTFTLKDSLFKFFPSLKHHNTSSLLLAITIAIVLLMQVSIVLLLSRPQRIHVITQSDAIGSTPGMNVDRAKAISSVKKQIDYLKEEMHFVEVMLEKMKHEHTILKGKLNNLELFRN